MKFIYVYEDCYDEVPSIRMLKSIKIACVLFSNTSNVTILNNIE
jgi:hypothetical protein